MEKSSRLGLIISILVISFLFAFIWFFSYINEPIGDDLLCYYEGALSFYLDDYEPNLGDRITTFQQVGREICFIYEYWSGRIPGYTLELIGKLLPKIIQAFMTAIVFMSNGILSARILFKKWKTSINNPLSVLLFFFGMYWYRNQVYYDYMWTMVSIYSFSILLNLLSLNLSVIDQRIGLKHKSTMIFVLGLFAGCSHEIIAFCMMTVIITEFMIGYVVDHKRIKSLLQHTGFALGYLIGFFAPGNFNRQKQSHDTISEPYTERLIESIRVHHDAIFGDGLFGMIALVLLTMAICILLWMLIKTRENKQSIRALFVDVLPLLAACGASVFLWGYASYVPAYGMGFCVMLYYMIVIRALSDFPFFKTVENCTILGPTVALATFCLFIFFNAREIVDYSRISIERRRLAQEAVQGSLDQIEVPRFGDDLSAKRYFLQYLNDQDEYDLDYYIGYYGTRLIITDEK